MHQALNSTQLLPSESNPFGLLPPVQDLQIRWKSGCVHSQYQLILQKKFNREKYLTSSYKKHRGISNYYAEGTRRKEGLTVPMTFLLYWTSLPKSGGEFSRTHWKGQTIEGGKGGLWGHCVSCLMLTRAFRKNMNARDHVELELQEGITPLAPARGGCHAWPHTGAWPQLARSESDPGTPGKVTCPCWNLTATTRTKINAGSSS